MTASVAYLPAPTELRAAHPADRDRVDRHREAVVDVLNGADDRLLVVVGPCSVHDVDAGLEYAARLATVASELADNLLVVMRAYLEKPRTRTGWRGLLPDPRLDSSGDVSSGLVVGRDFLCRATKLGLPLAYEFVDPLCAPYVSDLVSWGAIGARTVTSQTHRQLASSLTMPVGIKNSLTGEVQPALDAIQVAAASHSFPLLDLDGRVTVVRSTGNPNCHVVLRGGTAPNYDAPSVSAALWMCRDASVHPRVIVDAAHGNSGKQHGMQMVALENLAGQVAGGQRGIAGVMFESFLASGRQDIDAIPLRCGVSVTDPCLGWDTTAEVLHTLSTAARSRRHTQPISSPWPSTVEGE